MNHNSTALWSPMVSGPEDEFANFLEFTDLQLEFPFDDGIQDGGETQPESAGTLDMQAENEMGLMGFKDGDSQQHQQLPQIDPSLMHPQTFPSSLNNMHSSTESLMDMNIGAQLFHERHRQYQPQYQRQDHYQRQGIVPPTPNSIEMHGGHQRYYQQVDPQAQASYEHYAPKHQEQMIFTPLVSPAVTPLDTQFRMPEYTIPGEYFSPLTSPALEAQCQQNAAQRSVYGAVRGSDTSATTSPVELSVDINSDAARENDQLPRKSRRKTAPIPMKNTARAVRQSPVVKSQTRKKQPSSTTIPTKEVAGIAKARKSNSIQSSPYNGSLPRPQGQDSSEAESVSPEPLSEALMPPPATPRPGSAGRSPYLKAGSQPALNSVMKNSPATPASLMRIQKQNLSKAEADLQLSNLKEQTIAAEAEMAQIIDDIVLPEPIRSMKPGVTSMETLATDDNEVTPTMAAQIRTPSTGLVSAPPTATSTVFPSPQLGAMASPSVSVISKRGDQKSAPRSSKKRNSSSHVSPALRPRISPSIKPLLPEGTSLSTSTTALLLASKSNYQNILEGTHLPGVSYPSTLATNLTSKRTSHKIAEQGRRNRINLALGEIAALLPAGMGGSGGEGAGEGGGGSGNSKARTVEAAIEYIQMLKGEVRELKGRLEAVEKEKEIEAEVTDMTMVNEDNGGIMSSHEIVPTPEIIEDGRTTPNEQTHVTETEAETEA